MSWSFTDWSPDDSPGEVHKISQPAIWDKLLDYYTNANGNPAPHESSPSPRSMALSASSVNVVTSTPTGEASTHASTAAHSVAIPPCATGCISSPDKCLDIWLNSATCKTHIADIPSSATTDEPGWAYHDHGPSELSDGVRCEGDQDVDLFGWPLRVRAMPFISQDAQYLRCAHAALWMVLAHAHLVHGLPCHLPAEVYDAALGGVIIGRQLPSDGLSGQQMLGALTSLGLSPSILDLPSEPEADKLAGYLSLYGVLCRYITSAMPPIVTSDVHAWVVTAYRRRSSESHGPIQLWRHDDVRGPYLPVNDPGTNPFPLIGLGLWRIFLSFQKCILMPNGRRQSADH